MDAQTLQYLSDDQADRWRKLEETFRTEGWKLIEEWAEVEEQAEFGRAANASSWDANRVATGARLAYNRFRNLAEQTEKEFAVLAAETRLQQEWDDEEAFE